MYQHFSSLALTVWDTQCFEHIFTKDDLIHELINDKCVYRTAPATLGLLNINSHQELYIIDKSLHPTRFLWGGVRTMDKKLKTENNLLSTVGDIITYWTGKRSWIDKNSSINN